MQNVRITVWIRGRREPVTFPPTRKGAAAAAAFVRSRGGKCTRAEVHSYLRSMQALRRTTSLRGLGWNIIIMTQTPASSIYILSAS